ncbi:glycosyltransferase family 4 protein [Phenylobacterium sp.]|jgi:glycosyltransferase involved in cell wall biosynthesis|uniref:glycosyltransferase family 4 protein n=1 Tax=Phenylobacterium sp. TaxID=1871053 RepID=UPI002F9459CE
MAARQVIINWSISSFYGWGVYGQHLALAWANDPEIEAACAYPIVDNHLALDPLRKLAFAPFAQRSAELVEQLKALKGEARARAVVLHCLEHRFEPEPTMHGAVLHGSPTIGVTFFNDTRLAPEAVQRAAAYPVMVAGSDWQRRLLEAYGLSNVRLIIQGVDPSLFHPGARQGMFPGRFLVFSGGKLERRKGQDIVLAAFRRFAERRPDALLVTAWHSPWPAVASTLDESGLVAPVAFTARGRLDVAAWGQASGVKPQNLLDLGVIPNPMLPAVLREMDVAVFPNRCEGGTNLVAMEAMACGVPTVLSRNTGHLDLIEDGNSYVLQIQRPLSGVEAPVGDIEGWGESDPDELVDALERAYADREDARLRGGRGAQTLSRFTWAETARQMKDLIVEVAGS